MRLTRRDFALLGVIIYFTFIGGTFYSQLNFYLRVANQILVTLILGSWLFIRLRKGPHRLILRCRSQRLSVGAEDQTGDLILVAWHYVQETALGHVPQEQVSIASGNQQRRRSEAAESTESG